MLKFNDYFEDQYRFSVKSINYSSVDTNDAPENVELVIADSLETELNNNSLLITYSRNVNFKPTAVFDVSVIFNATLQLKSNVSDDFNEIDWNTVLQKDNPCINNLISRASSVIANITSSFGQQPLITPPVFVTSNK